MKRLLLVLILSRALFACQALCHADTLTFTINSAPFNDGTMYVGAYNSTVAGDNFNHSAGFILPVHSFCIDYTSHVGFGQTFSIQTVNLASYSGPLATEYWEAGWIALQISNTTDISIISAAQRAIWQITTPGSTDPYLHGAGVDAWVTLAQANFQTVSADHFQLYLRDGVEGQNQLVILNVPEPKTYALLGIGLLSLVGFNIRRKLYEPQ